MEVRRHIFVGLMLGGAVVACSGARATDTGSGAGGTGGGRGGGGSATTGGAGPGTGGALACMPGASSACYTGDPATLNVGTCHAGTAICKADGSGVGPCMGEVTPKPEDCHTQMDTNCDGTTHKCGGEPIWTKVFGAPSGGGAGEAIATDAAGNVYVTGAATGEVDFGDGPTIGGASDGDVFVLKLDPMGNLVWDHRFIAPPSHQFGTSIAVDAMGNVYIMGVLADTVDFGDGPLTAPDYAAFLVKFDSAGNTLWSKAYGGGVVGTEWMKLDASGNPIVSFIVESGGIDFGSGNIGNGLVLAKLDPNGQPLWIDYWSDAPDKPSLAGEAVDAQGNISIVGYFQGTTDFGTGPITSSTYDDLFVARYSADGLPLDVAHYPTSLGFQVGCAITNDGAGNTLIGGSFASSLALPSGTLTGSPYGNAFTASFDPVGGENWSRPFVCTGYDGMTAYAGATILGLASDSQAAVVATGAFFRQIDLGTGMLTERGQDGGDAFVVKLGGADGATTWVRQIGGSGADWSGALAIDANDAVLWTGELTPPFDLGDGIHGSAGDFGKIVVAKLTP